MTTRFQQELSGKLGAFWQKHAEEQLAHVKADLARNCIGRVLMDDLLEMVEMVTDKANRAATQAAREIEVEKALAEYRAAWRPPSGERLAEMRAVFGEGATVVDVLAGETIQL